MKPYHTLLLFFAACVCLQASAQNNITQSLSINWQQATRTIAVAEGKEAQTLSFEGAMYEPEQHWLPIFAQKTPVNATGRIQVTITNAQYEAVVLPPNLLGVNDVVQNNIVPQAKIAQEKKKPFALLSFVPLRRTEMGGYEKLISCDLVYQIQPQPAQRGIRQYTNNSVFNQGDLYRFKVTEEGVYKIDFAFLSKLGISQTVPIANLRIYGNGGGMLPELSSGEKYDDLLENPIQVSDNNQNNVFDSGDFLIFYAQSPNQWSFNPTTKRFEWTKNVYSDYNYYYLNFDIGAGKRIAQAAPNTATPTIQLNTFSDYVAHEIDEDNPNYSGRTWYGELFNAQRTEQTFNFTIPNLDLSAQQYLTTSVAGRTIAASASFSTFVNDALLQTMSISTVTPGYEYDYGRPALATTAFTVSNNNPIGIKVRYNIADAAAEGWLNYLVLNVRRSLICNGQMGFRDGASVAQNAIAQFNIQANNSLTVWDISRIDQVQQIPLNATANGFSFVAQASQLRQYIAFDGTQFLTPEAEGIAEKQNLHAPETPDMVVISHPNFVASAQQLADFHQQYDQLNVKIVTPQQIYNEFSSGKLDVTAMRDYLKMLYDRAENDQNAMPQYVLFWGDASYDYKDLKFKNGTNSNFVPTYESPETLSTTYTYCSDDFFGYLDDNEGETMSTNKYLLDIGIGRIPIKSNEEGSIVVDKIRHYTQQATMGNWRNDVCFIGDDEDGNTHLNDAEEGADFMAANHPAYNINKIYLDAYQQITTAGGNRYPAAKEALNAQVFSGALMLNYSGHGGEDGWTYERVLDASDLPKWRNTDKMPLFVTATCSFARYDNPDKYSIGEKLMLYPNGGAIALMTTVRLVYAGSNATLNSAFTKRLFEPISGTMPTIGEAARLAKNDVFTLSYSPNFDSQSSAVNNHKFALFGDPALHLAYPQQTTVVTTQINNKPLTGNTADTIRALQTVTVKGEVRDQQGNRLESFNGIVYPTVFDKKINIETLGNDPSSPKTTFDLRRNVLFKGQVSVTNGSFEFSFIVPKDINYQYGTGRISYYAADNQTDFNGYTETLYIGGINDQAFNDQQPPQIDIFMGDERFVFGSTTDKSPLLIAKIRDENGINTAGSGVGHDITGVLNDDNGNAYTLNQYYKTDLNSYKSGQVQYPLNDLPEGLHRIEVKAWDINNNSGKGYTEFVVASSAELALKNVLNYPNPFMDYTQFWFEHNRPNEPLNVMVQVYTLSGKLIKTLHQEIQTAGYRSDDITWDGLDDFGSKIGRGAYVYILTVKTNDNKTARQVQRLVVLK